MVLPLQPSSPAAPSTIRSTCWAQTAMSPVYNYTFIHHLGWRTDGAALAVLCCQATNAVILNGWRVLHDSVLRAGAPDATWGGCSPRSALKGWGHFLSIGIPAAAMIWCAPRKQRPAASCAPPAATGSAVRC